MSKPRNPIVGVLKYFETTELALAQQALALAQDIVRRRVPKGTSRAAVKTSARRKGVDGPGVADSAAIS